MKKVILIVILTCSVIAYCRVGETYKEIVKRYGKPKSHNEQFALFKFTGFDISVLVYKDTSIVEIFELKDENNLINREIPENQIDILLKANLGESYSVLESSDFEIRYTDNKNYMAIYNNVVKQLKIIHYYLFKEWGIEDKKKTEGKMKGF